MTSPFSSTPGNTGAQRLKEKFARKPAQPEPAPAQQVNRKGALNEADVQQMVDNPEDIKPSGETIADIVSRSAQDAGKKAEAKEIKQKQDESPELIPSPVAWSEFVGQNHIKKRLQNAVKRANIGKRLNIGHILFTGPAGVGKTTAAGIVAHEFDAEFIEVNGPQLTTIGEVQALAYSIDAAQKTPEGNGRVMLFVDEIHGLKKKVQDVFLRLMQSYKIDQKDDNKTFTLLLRPFTLVGATTEESKLQKPMMDRFQYKLLLREYTAGQLVRILIRAIPFMKKEWPGYGITKAGAKLIAQRSRGEARTVLMNLLHVYDHTVPEEILIAKANDVKDAFEVAGINKWGLTETELSILIVLSKLRRSQWIGVEQLGSRCGGITKDSILAVHEPFLTRNAYIDVSSRGRKITREGRAIVKLHEEGRWL